LNISAKTIAEGNVDKCARMLRYKNFIASSCQLSCMGIIRLDSGYLFFANF
jgi:hypothetical protein